MSSLHLQKEIERGWRRDKESKTETKTETERRNLGQITANKILEIIIWNIFLGILSLCKEEDSFANVNIIFWHPCLESAVHWFFLVFVYYITATYSLPPAFLSWVYHVQVFLSCGTWKEQIISRSSAIWLDILHIEKPIRKCMVKLRVDRLRHFFGKYELRPQFSPERKGRSKNLNIIIFWSKPFVQTEDQHYIEAV